MLKWFNDLPRGVQIIILLIPFVNWVVEICVRWSRFNQKETVGYFILALVFTLFGLVFGYLDAIWCLLFHHLIFAINL